MAATAVEDQTLDVDGWEIENGTRQSSIASNDSSCQLDQCCPDVVLKAQPVRETSRKEFLRCPVCLNGYKYLKNLGCQCNVCANCAERLLSQWRDEHDAKEGDGHYKKTRLCTVCDQEHSMPSLVHTALKPIFDQGALKCMSCHGKKDTQDAWWCQDCSTILCSKCAHKSHRDHVTMEFDQDYDAVRYCLAMFQLDSQSKATRLKTMTWAKFEEIFKKIEAAIDTELESQNKIRRARLTDIFGNRATNQHSQGDVGYDKLHRRLSTIQQKAVHQYPHVLEEMLSLTGLGAKETVGLKTEVVSGKIVDLLKSTINQLAVDDFKIVEEQITQKEGPENDDQPKGIMYIGDQPELTETSYEKRDVSDRHY